MKRLAMVMVLAALAGGCGRSAPQTAKPTNERQAILPAAPILAGIAGKWGHDGQMVVSIAMLPNGSALLQIPEPGEGWRAEVRNARVDNGKIVYEQYHYAQDVPNHPIDGVRCDVVLEPVPGFRDRVKLTVTAEGNESATRLLGRME